MRRRTRYRVLEAASVIVGFALFFAAALVGGAT